MQNTTLSGPRETVREAGRCLAEAGYFVLSVPTTQTWLELAEAEAFLSVDGQHSDVASIVAHLGWRHRGIMVTAGSAVAVASV
jgi:hypothetical protein